MKKQCHIFMIFSFCLLLGLLGLAQPAQAESTVTTEPESTFNSNGYDYPIYVRPTDKTAYARLSYQDTSWKIKRLYQQADGSDAAIDLGQNQWVKLSDVLSIQPNNQNTYQLFFSNNEPIKMYTNATLQKSTGQYLSTSNNQWRVSKLAYYKNGQGKQTKLVYAMELGKNQWIARTRNDNTGFLKPSVYFAKWTKLVNSAGQETGYIQASGDYKAYELTNIHGQVYVRLGNDNQWAPYIYYLGA